MKQIVCLLLAFVMILSLSSCGKEEGERVTNVFRSEEIGLPEGFVPNDLYKTPDGYAMTRTDHDTHSTRLVRLDSSMKLTSDETLDDIIYYAAFLPDGDIVYTTSNDTLRRRGNREITIPQSDLAGQNSIVNIIIGSDGSIFLATQFSAVVVDDEFNVIFHPVVNGTIQDVFTSTDGRIYLSSYDKYNGAAFFGYVDASHKKIVQVTAENQVDRNTPYIGTVNGSMWFRNLSGIYKNDESGISLVCDFLNSDLVPSKIGDITPLDDEHIVLLYDGSLLSLTHLPDDQVKPRKLIRVAGTRLPSYLADIAAEFNRRSDEYRITLVDYSAYYDSNTKMRNEIIAGKIPDIMYIRRYDQYREEYMNQKLFTDLWKVIDADKDFDRSDIIMGTLKSGMRGDELYVLPTKISISTLTIKTKHLPKTSRPGSWTLREFLDWAKGLEGVLPVADVSQSDLLFYMLRCSTEEFIDYENGTCSFDSDLFRETLEFAKECNTDRRTVCDSSGRNYPYRTDKVMLYNSWHDQVRGFLGYMTKDVFRTLDTTYVGFPDSDGNGLAVELVTGLAITEKSEVKDAAWEFIKMNLTEPTSEEMSDGIGLMTPLRSVLYDEFERLSAKYHIADTESGDTADVKVEKFKAEDYPSDRFIVYEYTAEEAAKFAELLDGANTSLDDRSTLWAIIKEDAEAYFAGAKTLDETVKIIQDRAGTYVAEHN